MIDRHALKPTCSVERMAGGRARSRIRALGVRRHRPALRWAHE